MATRKRTTASGGFSAETSPVEEERVVVITEPSTPEELQEEVKALEEFTIEVPQEVVETPATPEPPKAAPTVQNPEPVKKVGLTRHRRNIPRFSRR